MSIDSWFEGYLEEGPLAPLVTFDSATGFLMANGAVLDGSPPAFSWATKPAAGATGYSNTVVLITDLHSRGSSGGSLWMNTTGGYICVSSPPNVTWSQLSNAAWFGTSGGALNPTVWPGLRLRLTDYFIGNPEIYCDGTRWRLSAGRATLANPPESALTAVAINQTNAVVIAATWPIGLYLDGDRLALHLTGQKSGVSDTVALKLGYSTSSTVYAAGTALATASLTTTVDGMSSVFAVSRKSNTVMKVKGPANFATQSGLGSSDTASDVTVTDLNTTQGYILFACTTGANETFLLSTFFVELVTCGA